MAYIGTPPANRPLTSFDIGENNITSFNISEAVIETLDIVDGSVIEEKLAANSVTSAKLATNFVGNVIAGTGLILVGNTYAITNSGVSAYTINGSTNPSLTLFRGHTYTFNVSASNHPFWIKTSNVTGTGSTYDTGVTNNGTENGTITFTVPSNAPDTLYYICQNHLPMYGTINVSNVSKNANITIGVADSGITAGTYGNATSIPAVTVNSKGQVTAVSNVAVAGGFSNMIVYTADATWTVPAGVTRCKVTAVGAGGGGGAYATSFGGGGGGGGQTSISYVNVVPSQTATITIGNGGLAGTGGNVGGDGGNSTFIYSGTNLVAVGGRGGLTYHYIGGIGGTGGTAGMLNPPGANGGHGSRDSDGPAYARGGDGGSTTLGGGGTGGTEVGPATQPVANSGGGGGGSNYNSSPTPGAYGIVIIEY